MPEYKLIYFNVRGSAEITRWLFTYAGIEFTDERVEQEDWPERKPNIPGGKLPVLYVDESPLPQSMAIARYVAKEAGLVPEDNMDAAYCDALADTFKDIMVHASTLMFKAEDDDERQKLFEEEIFPNSLQPMLKRLNGRLDGREWFASDEMTWADMIIAQVLNHFLCKQPNCLEHFPNVAAHVEKICELPAIKEYIENRPDSMF